MGPETSVTMRSSEIVGSMNIGYDILYSGYISRALYFGELTKFANSKPRQTPNFIQLIHNTVYRLIQGSKLAKLKRGQISKLQIRQNSAPPN